MFYNSNLNSPGSNAYDLICAPHDDACADLTKCFWTPPLSPPISPSPLLPPPASPLLPPPVSPASDQPWYASIGFIVGVSAGGALLLCCLLLLLLLLCRRRNERDQAEDKAEAVVEHKDTRSVKLVPIPFLSGGAGSAQSAVEGLEAAPPAPAPKSPADETGDPLVRLGERRARGFARMFMSRSETPAQDQPPGSSAPPRSLRPVGLLAMLSGSPPPAPSVLTTDEAPVATKANGMRLLGWLGFLIGRRDTTTKDAVEEGSPPPFKPSLERGETEEEARLKVKLMMDKFDLPHRHLDDGTGVPLDKSGKIELIEAVRAMKELVGPLKDDFTDHFRRADEYKRGYLDHEEFFNMYVAVMAAAGKPPIKKDPLKQLV